MTTNTITPTEYRIWISDGSEIDEYGSMAVFIDVHYGDIDVAPCAWQSATRTVDTDPASRSVAEEARLVLADEVDAAMAWCEAHAGHGLRFAAVDLAGGMSFYWRAEV